MRRICLAPCSASLCRATIPVSIFSTKLAYNLTTAKSRSSRARFRSRLKKQKVPKTSSPSLIGTLMWAPIGISVVTFSARASAFAQASPINSGSLPSATRWQKDSSSGPELPTRRGQNPASASTNLKIRCPSLNSEMKDTSRPRCWRTAPSASCRSSSAPNVTGARALWLSARMASDFVFGKI